MSYTTAQMRQMCQEQGLTGYSKLNKAELEAKLGLTTSAKPASKKKASKKKAGGCKLGPDEGYCVKCKKASHIDNGEVTSTVKGSLMMKGSCNTCGTTMCKILPKDFKVAVKTKASAKKSPSKSKIVKGSKSKIVKGSKSKTKAKTTGAPSAKSNYLTLKHLRLAVNELSEEYDDLPLIYAHDDEGNEHQFVQFLPNVTNIKPFQPRDRFVEIALEDDESVEAIMLN